jgi:glycosyltransferase involved in cell wall biosynthesis
MNLTLAITTYNRTELLFRSFEKVVDDPRISEIIIVDDRSDLNIFEAISTRLKRIEKVRLYRNNKNLGVYHNKHMSVKMSSNEWVIVFDSDNVIDKTYLDALEFVAGRDGLSKDIVYTPSFARPKFDYRHMAGKYINRMNVGRFFREAQFDCLINTMNCVVHKASYLEVYNPDTEPAAADSAYFNYRWLQNLGQLYVVPGMEYDHLVHDGSHYVQTIGASNKKHAEVMRLLKIMS